MDILSALATLDPLDDSNWTTDGAPRLDVVAAKLGAPQVSRQQVRAVAPEFHRNNPTLTTTAAAAAPLAPATPAPAAPPAGSEQDEGKVDDAGEGATTEEPKEPAERSEVVRAREVDAEIMRLQQQRGEIDNQLTRLAREQEALARFSPTRGYDHKADQEARAEFIRAEQQRHLDRVTRASKIAAAAGVVPVAPIDRAMARKTGRGHSRPAFPLRVSTGQGD